MATRRGEDSESPTDRSCNFLRHSALILLILGIRPPIQRAQPIIQASAEWVVVRSITDSGLTDAELEFFRRHRSHGDESGIVVGRSASVVASASELPFVWFRLDVGLASPRCVPITLSPLAASGGRSVALHQDPFRPPRMRKRKKKL